MSFSETTKKIKGSERKKVVKIQFSEDTKIKMIEKYQHNTEIASSGLASSACDSKRNAELAGQRRIILMEHWLKANNFVNNEGAPSFGWKKDTSTMLFSSFTTAMHEAVRQRNISVLEAMIKCGAKQSTKDSEGVTALHLAQSLNSTGQYDQIVELLIEAKRSRERKKLLGDGPTSGIGGSNSLHKYGGSMGWQSASAAPVAPPNYGGQGASAASVAPPNYGGFGSAAPVTPFGMGMGMEDPFRKASFHAQSSANTPKTPMVYDFGLDADSPSHENRN